MDGAALRKVFVKNKSSGMHEIYYNIENNLFVPVSADEKRDWRKIELLKGQRTRRQKEKQDEAHEPECSHVCQWYRRQYTWLCSHAQYLSAIVNLNSLVHVPLLPVCSVEWKV